ncbi:NAD(P)H-binding protein [Paenibacillus oenotherae]|uniref:NAD(P)H-binding protein n=1 Tax=Paenibacillus oenotherae TaxID=1435645 RepID=A0ABS7DAU6_9BACL|nr:NAD(P)H-binding protein [Paenibacillus oenotherae]MBW7477064.1 NAD(P)H-binding protein [Paenibacillus oenotherae]
MKLLLLGATGRVGKEVAAQAIEDGHQVTLLVRSPEKLDNSFSGATVVHGDACVEKDLFRAVLGMDAVISALSTDGGSVLTDSTPLLIAAMHACAVKRVITIGTAGILDSRRHPGLLRYETPDSRRSSTRAAEEHRRVWELLSASGLDWTIVCPTYLPLGDRTGVYRVERDCLPLDGLSISVADTAQFAYKQLWDNSYIGARAGIAY